MSSRSSRAASALLLATLACSIAPAQATEPPHANVHGAQPVAGPIVRTIPAGAVVAESAADLSRMLQNPTGPQDIWLRARRYDGDFRITRSLALHGERGATLRGTGRGTVLAIEADDVSVDNLVVSHSGQRHTAEDAGIRAKGTRIHIRNLRVEDSLFGITLAPCPRCELEHVHVQGPGALTELQGDGIKLWESDDASVRNSTVDGVRDVVVWYSRRVQLEGNRVTHSRYGSHFMYAHDSVVRNSRIENNVVGIFVMYSSRLHVENNVIAGARGAAGVGIGFKESDGVRVSGNWVVANSTGTYLDETPRSADMPVSFHDNHFALNDVALRFHGVGEQLAFTHNDFDQNRTLSDVEGGGDALQVVFSGNYYSDYAGYDLDGDGTGDVAYQVKRLSADIVAAHPALAFFAGTSAMALVDAIATAMPVFASRLLLEDEQPRSTRWSP